MQPRPQGTELFSSPVRAVWSEHSMALEGEKGRRQRGAEKEALAGEHWAISKAFPLSSLTEREMGWQMGSVYGMRLPMGLDSSPGTAT